MILAVTCVDTDNYRDSFDRPGMTVDDNRPMKFTTLEHREVTKIFSTSSTCRYSRQIGNALLFGLTPLAIMPFDWPSIFPHVRVVQYVDGPLELGQTK
jgi:hypothetical protein